jgi:DNA-binding response OmpR family regulator
LENHNTDSARGALQVLGELGSPANADNSSLNSAMNYPNSRIQFAAANAIMNRGKVAADNRLIEVFGRVLNGAGQARGVIIDPTATRSQLLTSQLDGFGFKALVAHTGREGFRLAAESANVAIVLVNANCTDWALSETIVNLRADQRTASIPIVILGAASSQTRLEAMAARHQAMTFLDEDLVADTLARRLRPFVERFNPALSQRERSEQRALAAFWLAHLAETNPPARAALSAAESALANAADDPRLVSDALSALSRIPTTTAQTRTPQPQPTASNTCGNL